LKKLIKALVYKVGKKFNTSPYHSFLKDLVLYYLKEKQLILEIGCSKGETSIISQGQKYIGIDLDINFLNNFNDNGSLKTKSLVQGNILEIPLNSKTFDGIYCFGTLFILKPKEVEQALSEINRVGNKDSIFLLQFMNKYSIQYKMTANLHWLKDTFSYYALPLSNQKKLLEKYNFKIISSRHTYLIPYFIIYNLGWKWLFNLDLYLSKIFPFFACKNIHICRKVVE